MIAQKNYAVTVSNCWSLNATRPRTAFRPFTIAATCTQREAREFAKGWNELHPVGPYHMAAKVVKLSTTKEV